MAKEICISSTPHETRLAILEDDQLAEIYYERENEYTLAGSIYNGKVTRVLPGMQSAFVDVGLERDAFLYVTDFLELEDPEETDELEKATASGANTPPREVRHAAPEQAAQQAQSARGGRGEERQGRGGRGEERPGRGGQDRAGQEKPAQEKPAQERGGRERNLVVEPAVEAQVPQGPYPSEAAAEAEQDEAGQKRWRGRRRRRGGRGPAGAGEGQSERDETSDGDSEGQSESSVAPAIQAAAERSAAPAWTAPAEAPSAQTAWTPAARGSQAPTPFVLPGESLRKYGGTAEEEAPKAATQAPAKPASSFKPATLIEVPLEWDGSGLLPGESISRHRARPEPEPEGFPELRGVFADAEDATAAPDAVEEQELVAEQNAAEVAAPLSARQIEEEFQEEEQFEESSETAPAPLEQHVVAEPVASYEVEETVEAAPAIAAEPVESTVEAIAAHGPEHVESVPAEIAESEPEPADGSASHNVDPLPPSTFRLFGLGGKKKAEEPAPVAPQAPKPATMTSVSAYAPGSGLVEEEVIEGEEFDAAPHHHGRTDEHDLDVYEEETLPAQVRSGAFGEMLQEAHLDRKIQLKLDAKNGDEEDSFDLDEEEDEDEPAAGQAGAGQTQDANQQRRDRGGRGRRGGGRNGQDGRGSQGSQNNRRGGGPSRRSAQMSDLPIISDLLKPGQEILVQIAKEPIAKKGARITSHIALPGRFLVFMPTVSHVGVSRKIESDEERQRLKRILIHERGEATGGFIVRTAAEGASEDELRTDLRMLLNLWAEIKQRSDSSKSPALIYHDLGLIERILRDQVSSDFSSIWVDSEADYERIVRFLNRFSPSLVRRVKLYTKEVPLFEHFGIQDEISKALRSKVWLKSGGSIVINQTEALVAIDINTGKYVGKSARLEDTIVKTNLDAVPEIVRQIRLRDLGGIIVIDFIDMDDRKNRFRVMAALEEALKADRAPTKVLQFNDFGLVAITRKRVKQSLERTLSVPCPTCQATGMVKSPTTVCNEIYTELRKMKKHFEGADVLLRVNPETVKVLKANNAAWLTEFEELVSKNILVKSDATLHPEQFDIQG
jgi:ribonuclease G